MIKWSDRKQFNYKEKADFFTDRLRRDWVLATGGLLGTIELSKDILNQWARERNMNNERN